MHAEKLHFSCYFLNSKNTTSVSNTNRVFHSVHNFAKSCHTAAQCLNHNHLFTQAQYQTVYFTVGVWLKPFPVLSIVEKAGSYLFCSKLLLQFMYIHLKSISSRTEVYETLTNINKHVQSAKMWKTVQKW